MLFISKQATAQLTSITVS